MPNKVDASQYSERETRYFKLARNFYFASLRDVLAACGVLIHKERILVSARILHDGLNNAGVLFLTDHRLLLLVSHNLKPWVMDIPRENISSLTCEGNQDHSAISLMYAAPHGVTETRIKACAWQGPIDINESLAVQQASRATSALSGLLGRKESARTDGNTTHSLFADLDQKMVEVNDGVISAPVTLAS
jgi:hypothetical protein